MASDDCLLLLHGSGPIFKAKFSDDAIGKDGVGGPGDEVMRMKDELDKPSGDHKNYCTRVWKRLFPRVI